MAEGRMTIMEGKDKCEYQRGIRKRMAEAYGITYKPREWYCKEECSGTCLGFEMEGAMLMDKIIEKEGGSISQLGAYALFEYVAKKVEKLLMSDDYKESLRLLDEDQRREEVRRVVKKSIRGLTFKIINLWYRIRLMIIYIHLYIKKPMEDLKWKKLAEINRKRIEEGKEPLRF
jgi:hypothetical protein